MNAWKLPVRLRRKWLSKHAPVFLKLIQLGLGGLVRGLLGFQGY
jgi:hypothetical protein